jgi:ketosteroid isomerase-like protein
MKQSNLDVVKGIYAAWPKGIDAFLEALAPDVEWRFVDSFVYGKTNPLVGHDALRQTSLKALKTDWEGFDGELDELLDAGDTIVDLGHYVGTYKATGRRLRAQFAHVWTLKDGKVIRWRQYVDTKQFADVTGLEP